ncbi:hypothetical protein QBC42DRAFT_171943 [Cladorrhinum samala]|uniref:Sm domain-containing protein n=1 Tax=Cladorrhinum samala TaxID=585594 RepID=A0AAV9HTU4_9PEZI|nr:hypothetical protein QBC42DRAFT_171943 [Cladorrhinum samala]
MSHPPQPGSFFKRRRTQPAMDYDALPVPSSKHEASDFLQTLLNKNLRVTTTDSRMFWGSFKCTDAESNLVLQHVYEYRPPTLQQITAAAAAAAQSKGGSGSGKLNVDMTSRYLGLVVVPGKHIVKIEVEEFASQLRSARERRRREREAEEEKEDEARSELEGQVAAKGTGEVVS